MIENRGQAAKYLDIYYHSVRYIEKNFGLTYPITEEALTAIRATMRHWTHKDKRRCRYRYPARNRRRRAYRSFGRYITMALKRKDRPPKWLAIELGVSRKSVETWIRGEKYPRNPDRVRAVLGG